MALMVYVPVPSSRGDGVWFAPPTPLGGKTPTRVIRTTHPVPALAGTVGEPGRTRPGRREEDPPDLLADSDPRRTGPGMPRNAPPVRTRAGHLHATHDLPVRPGRATRIEAPQPGSGLAGRLCPVPPLVSDALVVARRLDRGRLCANELVAAAGWAPGTRLAVQLLDGSRLRLSAAPPVAAELSPVARSAEAHTDAKGTLVIPKSLRSWLGIEADGLVLARTLDEPAEVELVGSGALVALLDALDGTDRI